MCFTCFFTLDFLRSERLPSWMPTGSVLQRLRGLISEHIDDESVAAMCSEVLCTRDTERAASEEAPRPMGRRSNLAEVARQEQQEWRERKEGQVLSALQKAIQSVLTATAAFNAEHAQASAPAS